MAAPCSSACYADTYNVLQSVMNTQNYSTVINPFTGSSYPITIYVFVYLAKLLELTNSGTISLVAGLGLTWFDPRLQWSPAAYNNVSIIQVPVENIWIPELSLYNGITDTLALNFNNRSTSASLNYTGIVAIFTAGRYQATCSVDLTYFPFDSQSCTLRFVNIDTRQMSNVLQFSPAPSLSVYTGAYSSIGEFQFLHANLTTGVPRLSGLQLDYPGFNLTIYNKRNPSYYISNVAVPATMLIIASSLVFLLPSDNSVKIGMACSLMIALYILQQAVARLLPASPTTPLLAKGIMIALGLGLYSLACAIISVSMYALQPPLCPCLLKVVDAVDRAFSCCLAQSHPKNSQTAPMSAAAVPKYPTQITKMNAVADSSATVGDAEQSGWTKSDEIVAAIMQLVQLNKSQADKADRTDQERKKLQENTRRWKILDLLLNIIYFLIYWIIALYAIISFLFNLL